MRRDPSLARLTVAGFIVALGLFVLITEVRRHEHEQQRQGQ